MPQSLAKILVHTVFSTKNRDPLLRDANLRTELHRYIGGILNSLNCPPIVIGGTEDHIHVLSQLSRTSEPSSMVKEVKRVSSIWVKSRPVGPSHFSWQAGYGMFSIGFSQLESVNEYIENQEVHHKHRTFQDEFRTLLERYKIEYDERYVWD